MWGGLGVNSSRCLSFICSIQALKNKDAAVRSASLVQLLDGGVYREVASCFSLSMSASAWVSCS